MEQRGGRPLAHLKSMEPGDAEHEAILIVKSPASTDLAYTGTVTGEAATASANSAFEILMLIRALSSISLWQAPEGLEGKESRHGPSIRKDR